MASTVAALGAPSVDGARDFIRVADADVPPIEMVWNLAEQVWMSSREWQTCRMIDEDFGAAQSGPLAGWAYAGLNVGGIPDNPAATALPLGDPNSKGFQPFHFRRPDLLWAAGLRLQEHLFVEMNSGDNVAPRVALNWFNLDDGETFLSPEPLNIGVQAVGIADPVGRARRICTGWQNSPVAAPTKQDWYPLPYLRDSSSFRMRRLSAKARLVGGPGVGALGGSDLRTIPPILDSLYSHLVADLIPVADGAPVAEWTDASPLGRSLFQATPAFRPILVRDAPGWNGHAVVRFDGIDDWLKTAPGTTLGTGQPFCIFLVLRQFVDGGAQQVWHESEGVGPPLIYRADAGDALNVWGGGTERSYHVPGGWAAEPRMIVSAQFDGAASDVWHNLTQVLSGDMGGTGVQGMTIGAAWNQILPAKIEVAEIIAFYRALSTPERQQITNWLNSKYTIF